MNASFAIKFVACYALAAWAAPAFADMSLETKSAPASSTHKAVSAAPTGAGAAATARVTAMQGWVRATVAGQTSTGAFMNLTAPAGLELVGVSSPVAGVAEVHEMKVENNVMKMRAIPSLALPAGKTVALKPGGFHVMLMDLKQPTVAGTTVPVTLLFKDRKGASSQLALDLPVALVAPGSKAGAAEPAHAHHH